MIRRYSSAALLVVGTIFWSSCAAAQQVQVDFDSALFLVSDFLGSGFTVRGVDGDNNDIKEEDQLGMLSAVLAGRVDTECILPSVVTEIQAGFAANKAAVQAELTVTVGSQGTVDLIDQLGDTNPALGTAMLNLLAGIMTIADNSTIAYINALADQVIVKVLTGTPEEDSIGSVQTQINFTSAAFATFGDAGDETNYLGAEGDIDTDLITNLVEYTEPSQRTREEWLTVCCLDPPLRIVTLSGGGNRVTGISMVFATTVAGGTGNYTFAWHKGVPGNSTLLVVANTYSIDFLRTSDAGNYFCIIDDGVTTIFTPIRPLTVTFVPLFIATPLQNTTRAVGDDFTFTLGVQGGTPGPYVFEWKKGNDVLEGQTGRTLTLTNLQAGDAGQYSVSVTSNGGADLKSSGPVTLTVQAVLPILQITSQPQGGEVIAGSNFTLSVTVTGGSGNYLYQWRKGGEDIPGAENRTLPFNPIALPNSGIYDCVITDASPTVTPITSGTANVQVVAQPIVITQQPVSAVVALGDPHSFNVAASGGSGVYIYEWQRNEEPLFGVPNSPNLDFAAVSSADNGTYRCVISDAIESLEPKISNDATLEVIEPDPVTITLQPVGGERYAGDAISFSVAATGGSETFNYQWYRNDEPIPGALATTLVFDPVTAENAGTITCVVTDAFLAGFDAETEPAVLSVYEHLVIGTSPVSQALTAGDLLVLTGSASGGKPPLSYQWYRDDILLDGAVTNTLDLGGADLDEAGVYSLVVEDALTDTATSESATVTVELVPIPEFRATFNINMFAEEVVPPNNSPNFCDGTGELRPAGANQEDGAIVSISVFHSVGSVVQGESALAFTLNEGALGVNGAVLHNLNTVDFAIDIEFQVDQVEASKIMAGNTYLLFTSTSFPEGDIRGQILPEVQVKVGHAADVNEDSAVSLSELLRVIQLYNLDVFHCEESGEDGYAPGVGDTSCPPHNSDYNPQDWSVSLSELLRLIQFYNSLERKFHACDTGEDGFCPGPDPENN